MVLNHRQLQYVLQQVFILMEEGSVLFMKNQRTQMEKVDRAGRGTKEKEANRNRHLVMW